MTDQWRFVCPECGSCSVYSGRSAGYRCKVCDATFAQRYDKKNEQLV